MKSRGKEKVICATVFMKGVVAVVADTDRIKAAEQDYLAGMKYKDIAEKYGVTINTVKSWKQRYDWNRKKGCTQSKKYAHKQIGAYIPKLPKREEQQLTEGLTEKEKLFCEIYVQNFNATQAAIKAGYSPNSATSIGYENLRKPHIRAYIEALKELKRLALMVSEDDIVERYMRIAFADITDFVEFGRTTVPVMGAFGPVTIENKETGEKEVLTKEINDVRFKESSMVDGGIIAQIKIGKDGAVIKLEDRMKALEWLSDYFNMNPLSRHRIEYENALLELNRKKANEGEVDDDETGVVVLPEVLPENGGGEDG